MTLYYLIHAIAILLINLVLISSDLRHFSFSTHQFFSVHYEVQMWDSVIMLLKPPRNVDCLSVVFTLVLFSKIALPMKAIQFYFINILRRKHLTRNCIAIIKEVQKWQRWVRVWWGPCREWVGTAVGYINRTWMNWSMPFHIHLLTLYSSTLNFSSIRHKVVEDVTKLKRRSICRIRSSKIWSLLRI